MREVTRYILRQLTVGMLFVSIALSLVLWLTQSLRFIEMIVNKGLTVLSFLWLTMLLMPTFLVVIIPISLFAVVLFTYNKLNTDRELVVLRAAGLSNWALARPALILGLAATVVGWMLTVWIIPTTVRDFREMQWSVRNDITSVLLQEGAFNKFGEGLTIYVRSRSPNGELLGLLVHDTRNPRKTVTIMAERGALVYTDTGPRVLMVNGNRQEVGPNSSRLSLLYFDSYTVEFGNSGGDKAARSRDARERTMAELASADRGQLGSTEYRRYKVEMHQRLASPLYNLGFVLIALGALLNATFDRRGQGLTILTAVGLMVAVQAGALGSSNLATSNLMFLPAIYLNAVLPIAVAAWMLNRPPRRRRPAPAVGAGAA
ncbi:MAG: LPS export ABC transporter permease LptF [Actinomycetota bacterium]